MGEAIDVTVPAVACADRPARERDLALLRRHEPVVRYTSGELFLPISVEMYIGQAALYRRSGRTSERLAPAGSLDPGTLAGAGRAHPGESLYLRYVDKPLGRREYRQWRQRPDRVRFTPSNGAAAVGLLSRLIAAIIRLSLLMRGRVPGGFAAAAQQRVASSGQRPACHYYGHVTRDGGYTVLQYWFLYAMNDWRSTFGGVNDHEADWEQVTVFVVEHGDGPSTPAWVAFSSHDETGNDLRRRWDDPDLERVGVHPTVYAGAGSHSGACLPGDYLVTVAPDLPGWVRTVQRLTARVLRRPGDGSNGIGIPYIDYRRGDGVSVGPGQGLEWTGVLIDDATPWARDYRGLWGLDTRDPLGGERAPAGPRYERDQQVRSCWSQPVAWAALDSEAPTAEQSAALLLRREQTLRTRLAGVGSEIDRARDELRGARAVDQASGRSPVSPGRDVEALARKVFDLRAEQITLRRELDAVAAARYNGPHEDPVHAHLRHRALPMAQTSMARSAVVRLWASASASILLAAFGLILLRGSSGLLIPALIVVGAMVVIDAALRGRLVPLLLAAIVGVIVFVVVRATVDVVVGNARAGVGVLLLVAASYVAVQTVVDTVRRR